jgi:hypothetical protein
MKTYVVYGEKELNYIQDYVQELGLYFKRNEYELLVEGTDDMHHFLTEYSWGDLELIKE